MTDEQEILCNKNDLCKHLNDLGYVDFETYESNEQNQFDDNVTYNDFDSSLPSNGLKDDASELGLGLTPIDSYNHDMIMNLLKSKLMFLEDVKFVESVLSLCCIYDEKSFKYTVGAVATSFISFAAYFNRGIDSYLPLSCMAMSSIYAAWKLYKGMSELKRNKLVTLYVKSLQNLCIEFHKVLRFLKEVEILSTGQVSTQNVGSAMYIPLNSDNKLNVLPPWKTLPDIRKSVACSLIDVISIFSCGCDYLGSFSPSWMDIKSFSSNNQISLNPIKVMFEDIHSYDGCISIKDLQMLNDNYLLVQSEFLKWLAFYLCPAVWQDSTNKFVNFKGRILMKYLESTQTQICDTSSKLKFNFDLQKVFTTPKSKDLQQKVIPGSERLPSSGDLIELKDLQVELHQIFLLVLSTVQKAKSLEDCLDAFSSKIIEESYVPINDLKENLSQQLSIVRNDLSKVVKDYDYIYCRILKKKNVSHEDRNEETENTAHKPQNDNPERVNVGYSDFAVSSPDEVFLALSGSKPEDFELVNNDWCIEKKPKIPQTLLTELSTTLKPIKKVFEDRERLVLKKLGIQDIEIPDCIADKEAEVLIPTENETQNEAISESTENSYVQSGPVHTENSLLMANLLKTNLLAQQRKNIEEECFTDD